MQWQEAVFKFLGMDTRSTKDLPPLQILILRLLRYCEPFKMHSPNKKYISCSKITENGEAELPETTTLFG